ncbi:MAG TPA: PIG-L family deacetylase [Acidimicrobiia bacterium]|nr:PIG-L family deacetylase [Acidimicrobiia bacterium]
MAGELREWGTVTADELTRIVVLSPHLDDAVLGCGRFLAAHPGAMVLTVFAGAPHRYPDPMTWWDQLAGFGPDDDPLDARRKEDAKALAELGAEPVRLDFVEHQYLSRDDRARPATIVDELEAAIRRADPTMVVAPFGLANPDHDCTHEAALLVRERLPEPAWFCYEDTGYKHVPGLLAWRVARLFRSGVWPTPAVMPVDADPAAKDAALLHYSSQLRALEADWQLSAKLAAPEQYWRLAPPPEGWERLSS